MTDSEVLWTLKRRRHLARTEVHTNDRFDQMLPYSKVAKVLCCGEEQGTYVACCGLGPFFLFICAAGDIKMRLMSSAVMGLQMILRLYSPKDVW